MGPGPSATTEHFALHQLNRGTILELMLAIPTLPTGAVPNRTFVQVVFADLMTVGRQVHLIGRAPSHIPESLGTHRLAVHWLAPECGESHAGRFQATPFSSCLCLLDFVLACRSTAALPSISAPLCLLPYSRIGVVLQACLIAFAGESGVLLVRFAP